MIEEDLEPVEMLVVQSIMEEERERKIDRDFVWSSDKRVVEVCDSRKAYSVSLIDHPRYFYQDGDVFKLTKDARRLRASLIIAGINGEDAIAAQ